MKKTLAFATCCLLAAAISFGASQAAKTWPVRSTDRPRPETIIPAEATAPTAPPSDALILFDGTNFDEWDMLAKHVKTNPKPLVRPTWKIEDGFMEVAYKSGDLRSKREFGDCQIHIEWATPTVVKGSSQGRGNSGVFLLGIIEIQVLDSYENDTYPDGQAGALYAKYPPLINACRQPGQWQTYDIIFNAAKDDQPARLTILHNGVTIHHAVDPGSKATKFKIALQDHNNPTRFRNIWVRPLRDYDELPS